MGIAILPVLNRVGPVRCFRGHSYGTFRKPFVLKSYLFEMLFDRGRRGISSQLPHTRGLFAVVIR